MYKTEEIIALLSTTEGLEESAGFYRELLVGVDLIISGIEAIIDSGVFTSVEYNGIKNVNYNKGHLILEKMDLLAKKQSYESYLEEKLNCIKRNKDLENDVTNDCQKNWEDVYERAKYQAQKNLELAGILSDAKPNLTDILANQSKKNDLYLKLLTYTK